MKKFFLIAGGSVLVGLLGLGLFVGWFFYSVHSNRARAKIDYARGVQARAQQQAAEAARPMLIDPNNYQTENNWLATVISREIADMSLITAQPDQPPRDLKVKAVVDPGKPLVHVEMNGLNDDPLVCDLTPSFAWDPEGYAPLARKLLGNTPGYPPVPDSDATDVLSHLLTLTGPEIAIEDIRLSDFLQHHPASAQAHEAAALVLTALALRENAGGFSDNRNLLSRATAQLAVAQALRGDQAATWPGLIADAAIRTLAGREMDALGLLDSLTGRSDCPRSAQTWITALRLLAKQDWRVAQVTASSPLLLKIAWFQILGNDLSDTVATRWLSNVVPDFRITNAAQSTLSDNPEKAVPDWGRAVIAMNNWIAVQNSNEYTSANMPREFTELEEVLKIEKSETVNENDLAATFAEGENSTVSFDANHHPVVHVIGAGSFKGTTRRHLFNDIKFAYDGISRGLGLQGDAEAFRAQMDVQFRGVPQYNLERNPTGPYDIAEVPVDLAGGLHAPGLRESFYTPPVPFGTVHDIGHRLGMIDQIEQKKYPSPADDYKKLEEKLAQLLPDQRQDAISAWTKEQNAHPEVHFPQEPTALARELLKLAPDQYALATDCVFPEHLLAYAEPFLAYNMRSMDRIEILDYKLTDADREKILTYHVALEPDAYFSLASLLRKKGRYDEAAVMDRKAFAEGYDVVLKSNSVAPLVDYDFTHGLTDEALSVAQKAAEVYSQQGMSTYVALLGKLGRFDEAEVLSTQIRDRYNDNSAQVELYAAHPDHFPEKCESARKDLFPDGLIRVELADFKDKPARGCQIGQSPEIETDQLKPNDIIVALDGYKVGSMRQYFFIRALTSDPHMDLIVWRENKYIEVKISAPNRRFHANLSDA